MMIFKGINRVTQTYGDSHGGIDIVGDDNPTIHSVTEGTVYLVQKWDGRTKTGSQSYGNLVIIKADGKRFYYAHLKSIAVKQGQKVKLGDVIGLWAALATPQGLMSISRCARVRPQQRGLTRHHIATSRMRRVHICLIRPLTLARRYG